MKKLLSTILAVAMLASMSTLAFAETIDTETGTSTKDVQAKIVDTSTKETVYSVDVTWGAMKFTYEKSGSMDWDETKHEYTNNVTGHWTADGNEVTVTNHSNAKMLVALQFKKDKNVADLIGGMFSPVTLSLPSAEEKATDAPELTKTSTLTLSGEASTIGENFAKVGTVTVTIADTE